MGYGAKIDRSIIDQTEFKVYSGRANEVDALLTAEYEREKAEAKANNTRKPLRVNYQLSLGKAIGGEWNVNQPITYPSYFSDVVKFAGNPDIDTDIYIIFIPPYSADRWFRLKDDMDFYEAVYPHETFLNKGYTLNITPIEGTLYPSMDWMDAETGETVMNDVYTGKPDPIDGVEFAPKPPLCVRVLTDHLMPDDMPKFWIKLRPIIATWWM